MFFVIVFILIYDKKMIRFKAKNFFFSKVTTFQVLNRLHLLLQVKQSEMDEKVMIKIFKSDKDMCLTIDIIL